MTAWWLRIAGYAGPHRRSLAILSGMMLLSVGLGALQPWPMKLLVDHALAGDPLPASLGWLAALPGASSQAALVAWLAGSTVLLFALTRVAAITEIALRNVVGSRMAFDLGADLLDHLQRLSLRFHAARSRGDLIRRVMTDALCARELVLGVALTGLAALASVGIMFVVMWKLDRLLAVVAVAVALPLGLAIRRFTRPMTERSYEHQELEGQILAHAEQTLSALPIVQGFGREEYETLRRVFQSALDYTTKGKGQERHADPGVPFEGQDSMLIRSLFGSGYTLGQVRKKYMEGKRMGEQPLRQLHELLGAMGYLALEILAHVREHELEP